VRRGGVHLAKRLRRDLAQVTGKEVPLGTLDIALYRDDLSERASAPVVGPTDIKFPVTGKTIVLVDDVLYTGRTVRAALDELVDFGRPRRVLLAVLVDRGGRELPIAPDVFGVRLEVPEPEQVEVRLVEEGARADEVIVKPRGQA
jgi:pyrimidine operon attenuation protein / uracil phosphoribosyltransferase